MENKKNLPYIPLYTGDWEKDCNVLSLSAEAAWLRIIFKMFNNGKQSTYKVSTKALQNLWRVPEELVISIIEELEDNNICGIDRTEKYVIFTSRRYEKENIISDVRRKAVSQRKDRTNGLQASYKKDTNTLHNTENENEYEYEDKDDNEFIEKGGMGEKDDPDVITPEVDEDVYLFDNFWDDYDKKVGSKEKLRKKWKSISDANKLKIKDHIRLYKISQPDKKYRKNPETYINNKSWNDEIITSNGNRYTTNKRAGITEDYKNSILARLQGASDTEDVPEHNHTLRGF